MDIEEMIGMDNGHRRCCDQWTLKNMLNDAYTRISTNVPDASFDTSPEFLFEQVFQSSCS